MFSKLKEKLKSFVGKSEAQEKSPKKEKKSNKKIITKEQQQKDRSLISKFKKKLTTQTITQEKVDELLEPLEMILLENNVALKTVDSITRKLSEDLVGISMKKGELESTISESLRNSISEALKEPKSLIEEIKKHSGVYTIIFFGINGTGKTTSLAKLAHKLKSQKISCVFAAADTFRAASIEQLELHGKKLGIPVIKQTYGSDPTAVAFDAKKYAEKNKISCVLVDTAGRMYTKENLIKQMEKMIRVISPEKKIFVGESIAGNDAIEQVKTFDSAIGIDGIILSKADVDEKAGTVLSVSQTTGKPVYFLGTGQNYEDLEDFKKEKILKNLGL